MHAADCLTLTLARKSPVPWGSGPAREQHPVGEAGGRSFRAAKRCGHQTELHVALVLAPAPRSVA